MEKLTTIRNMYDYSEILQTYGLKYTPIEYYWQVGELMKTQGWVIHLSVIRAQLPELLVAIIPGLLEQKLAFRIVRDAGIAFNLLEGGFGYNLVGKMVCIYPESEQEAPAVVKWLLEQTTSFRGPHIPTDRHLGGIVHARYGSINPVVIKNGNGEWIKHIYNVQGQLIRDPYHIPFMIPEGVAWPFGDLTTPEKPKSRKLLNYKYYPLLTLKADVKGDVIRALYFRRLWQIKSCIIKQGRSNMFADDYGRDIQDRLKWQYDLYQDLHQDIPMPQVFDYFEEDGSAYLTIEFIKGQTLTAWINSIYKDRSWPHLLLSEKLLLLNQLLKILAIVIRLHKKGYIHRDITPENFLVDKKGALFLIDMELTWSSLDKPSQPPFQLGTPGHMSPEQMAAEMPTVKEDIYGMGSMAFVLLTNFYALKLIGQDVSQLAQSLLFFTDDLDVAYCIAACWSTTPAERPSLEYIKGKLEYYRERLRNKKTLRSEDSMPLLVLSPSKIKDIVQRGLNNLASPSLLSPKGRWISISMQQDMHIHNRQVGVEIQEGWYTGMAGPLWLIALAKQMEFSVEVCDTPYRQSWDYIEKYYFSQQARMSSSLYSGNAGIALALTEGLNSGLLGPEPVTLERLQQCFSITVSKLDLAEGVAGQGMALLQSSVWLDKAFSESLLASYVKVLTERQNADGSWNIYTGIDHGAAGIILFLLSYIDKYPDIDAQESAIKALGWLEKIGKRRDNSFMWPLATNTKLTDHYGMGPGMPGITLAFIKAYEVFKEPIYRKIVEQCLSNLIPQPVILDLTLGSGLSGLGETYLEAARVFKDPVWQARANWIGGILLHCYMPANDDSVYWLPFISDVTTADLFSGNGGIIHFLIRMLYPEQVRYPFSV